MLERYLQLFRQEYGKERLVGNTRTCIRAGELHRVNQDGKTICRLYEEDGSPTYAWHDGAGVRATGAEAVEFFDKVFNLGLLSSTLSDL